MFIFKSLILLYYKVFNKTIHTFKSIEDVDKSSITNAQKFKQNLSCNYSFVSNNSSKPITSLNIKIGMSHNCFYYIVNDSVYQKATYNFVKTVKYIMYPAIYDKKFLTSEQKRALELVFMNRQNCTVKLDEFTLTFRFMQFMDSSF